MKTATTGKLSAGKSQSCGCLSSGLRVIDRCWYGLRNRCMRRRHSYRLYVYHALTAAVNLVLFILAFVVYYHTWSQMQNVGEKCTLPEKDHEEDGMYQYLKKATANHAVMCGEDAGAPPACSAGDMTHMLNFVMLNGFTSILQMLSSIFLCCAYKKFTNLPREKLQHGRLTWAIKGWGCVAKTFPWLTRLFLVMQLFGLFVLFCMVLGQTCKGDLGRTRNCVEFDDGCDYFRLKNCLYYVQYCLKDPKEDEEEDPMTKTQCLDLKQRDKFSGHVDVRVVTEDPCERCTLLGISEVGRGFVLVDPLEAGDDAECDLESNICYATAASKEQRATAKCAMKPCKCRRLAADDDGSNGQQDEAAAGEEGGGGTGGGDAAPADPAEPAEPPEAEAKDNKDKKKEERGQECSWAPPDDAFFFNADQCAQGGSFMFRFSSVYIYFSGFLNAVLVIIGQFVRVVSWPEPWFHLTPSIGKEAVWIKFLRKTSP